MRGVPYIVPSAQNLHLERLTKEEQSYLDDIMGEAYHSQMEDPTIPEEVFSEIQRKVAQLAPEQEKLHYTIVGGTHIGISGLYGEKTFVAKDFNDLVEQIRKDIGLSRLPPFEEYSFAGRTLYRFVSSEGFDLFSFYIKETLIQRRKSEDR